MKTMRSLALALAAFATPAFAASAPAELDTGGLLRVCASLAVVIALIVGAGWLLRRLQGGVRSGTQLRCVESLAVGLKERVVLLQAGEHQFLLGVAPGNVRTLHVFDTPLAAAAPAQPVSAAAFRALLGQWRGNAS